MGEIVLDLDKNRIKEILHEAYTNCADILETSFDVTEDEFVSKVDKFLDSNRVTERVLLNLPSQKYPELIIEVNLRRKSVIARMANQKTRIHLNRYLTNL